jgi:hypothetical protein
VESLRNRLHPAHFHFGHFPGQEEQPSVALAAPAPVRAGVTAEPKGEPGDPVLIRGDLLDAGDPVAANLVFPLAKGLGTAANGSSSKIVATHVSLAIRGLA